MIYIGADHGGFELKEKLVMWLTEKGEEVEDLGAEKLEKNDDFVDYAMDVAEKILDDRSQMIDDSRGIVICRNGVGVDIVANRYPGIRCVLGFDAEQVKKARSDDDANMLALPADYLDTDKAKKIVEAFLESEFSGEERFIRRLTKIEAMTSADACGCGETKDECCDEAGQSGCGGACGGNCQCGAC